MNGQINSVYGGGIVHTIYINTEERDITIQSWIMNEWGIDNTVNGTLVEELGKWQ